MEYKFSIEKDLAKEVVRIAGEEVDYSITRLNDPEDRHKGIHEVRKSLKRLRSLLRLSRYGLSKSDFRHANETCRDQGRLLSDLRDATALIETLDKLEQRHPEWLTSETAFDIRLELLSRRYELVQDVIKVQTADRQVVSNLTDFQNEIIAWTVTHSGFDAWARGLKRIYDQGRVLFEQAYKHSSAEHFHEWRKRVKDLWHHVLLLEECWPEIMIPLGESLHMLSGYLGDEHDLNVFLSKLAGTDLGVGEKQLSDLEKLFHREIDRLRSSAFPLGRRIYAEKPADFVRRIGSYWETGANRDFFTFPS